VTIQIRQDLANLIDETVQLRQSDREDEGSRDALIEVGPGLDAAVTADRIVEIDLSGEPSDLRASRHDRAGMALENHSPYTVQAQPNAPPIDEEESLSEVAIRERLIEWLVGFTGTRGKRNGTPQLFSHGCMHMSRLHFLRIGMATATRDAWESAKEQENSQAA
jgi:hypothetical protein